MLVEQSDCPNGLVPPEISHLSGKMVYGENTMTLAPYIKIKINWEQYFNSLNKNRRRRLRRVLKNADSNHNIEYRYFHFDTIGNGLNKLFELHIKRWKLLNIRSPFTDPKMREFYRDIATCFNNKGWLNFTYLLVDGEMSSLIFAVVYNRRFYGAISARDPDYSELNLGHLHHLYVIKEAFNKGLTEFDFLRGDEPYKFHWTRHCRRYQRILIVRTCLFSKLSLLYKNALLRVIEIINNKHSPKELLGLISYHIKNRKLGKKIRLTRLQ